MPDHARILSQQEIRELFRALHNTRDQALFALGIYSGLRISEIITLKYNQIYNSAGGVRTFLKIARTKKTRTLHSEIPVHPKLRDRLFNYKDECQRGTWLFPSEDSTSGHIERVRAHYILRNAFDSLRLRDASTHSMRRTCLANMCRAGIPLSTIQEISGHSSLSQLQEYLDADPADKHRAINMLKY